uniref:Cyclic nucleotide-binding domain-containing protein n=1 Tax=Ananas comosus var. bracteatus TaxID=296719 RepID=A0A6V7P207_ANACO|nr:unnamed protein product [Ananas comosus var. bracteatus]
MEDERHRRPRVPAGLVAARAPPPLPPPPRPSPLPQAPPPPPGAAGPAGGGAAALRRRRPWQPRRILDPGGDAVLKWNRVFLVSCLVALFVDPLYFYLLYIGGPACVRIDVGLGIAVTFFRTVADLFYLAHMLLKFRIAFVAPSSRVFGRGSSSRTRTRSPCATSRAISSSTSSPCSPFLRQNSPLSSSSANHTNNTLSLIVLMQYIPRLFLIFPLNARIVKATGVVTKTAWAGAAYNLLLYMLASHVLGALCSLELPERKAWLNSSLVRASCDATSSSVTFNFGMFADALNNEIVAATFLEKYLYCLWWGLRNLSSYAQNLETSTYIGETSFAILISIIGLVLFSHLIGNMQTYLQSITVRREEWRVKRRDIEEWMRHRQLPPDLQERVQRFVQYKWLATRGVDEEAILRSLPLDLRREIQRHLCLALVRRVPFFSQMDAQLLDAICERLVSSLSTKDTYIVREGDPVNEMLFVIRGQLESSTTNGGRTGFFNSITLRPGDFCGEELLTWALMPNPSANFPSSTRTVRALSEVEAFALRAEDLKFVANQFKRLHSKKLQHAFRFYSHQWRTWGACFIQAAWRRYKKRKLARELAEQESHYYVQAADDRAVSHRGSCSGEHDGAPLLADYANDDGSRSSDDGSGGEEGGENGSTSHQSHLGATILASKFAKNKKKGGGGGGGGRAAVPARA